MEHTYTVDGPIKGEGGGLYPGELISGIIYSPMANDGLISGEDLKPGRGFKEGFYGIL